MDIQSANVEELSNLPGVGSKRAKKIHDLQAEGITMKKLVLATGITSEAFMAMVDKGMIKPVPVDEVAAISADKTEPEVPQWIRDTLNRHDESLTKITKLLETLVPGEGPLSNDNDQDKNMEPEDTKTDKFISSMLHTYPNDGIYSKAYERGNTGKQDSIILNSQDVARQKEKTMKLRPGNQIEGGTRKSRHADHITNTRVDSISNSNHTIGKHVNHYPMLETENSQDSDSSLSDSSSESTHSSDSGRRRRQNFPKLDTFDGDSSKWNGFYFHFKEASRAARWSEREKRHQLASCLRGRVVDYIKTRPREVRRDFKRLVKDLKQRYGRKESESSMRRDLQNIKQDEHEQIDDFADRVLALTFNCFPGSKEKLVQSMAVDAFFRGTRETRAACFASEKEPKTIPHADRCLKSSIQNCRLIPQTNSAKPSVLRQVSFDDHVYDIAAVSSGQDMDPVISCIKEQPRLQTDQSKLIHQGLLDQSRQLSRLCDMLQSVSTGASRPTRSPSPGSNWKNRAQSPDRTCHYYQKIGHFARDCPEKTSRNRSPSPGGTYKCYKCQEMGHLAKDCSKGLSQVVMDYKSGTKMSGNE